METATLVAQYIIYQKLKDSFHFVYSIINELFIKGLVNNSEIYDNANLIFVKYYKIVVYLIFILDVHVFVYVNFCHWNVHRNISARIFTAILGECHYYHAAR